MSSPVEVETLIIGAGMSGLGFASFWKELRKEAGARAPALAPVVVLERAHEPGGYCRTVKQDGFTWDYSGHFFHFRHKELEQRLVTRLPAGSVRTIHKRARVVDVDGCEVSFPYQRSLGELPRDAFAACLKDLWDAERGGAGEAAAAADASFKSMLLRRLGRSICERFLFPYNEKLYATDLDRLDPTCMGRFFPTTTFTDVMGTLGKKEGDEGYNATFTYPRGGAIEYVQALLRDLVPGELHLSEPVQKIDLVNKKVTTAKQTYKFERLVTSAPLPATCAMAGLDVDAKAFTGNRVLVFNLGFDKKGREGVHWVYFASKALPFYRVGYYDNIFGDDRMSLYVEIGLPAEGDVDVDASRIAVLDGLRAAGVITDQKLVSWHHVVMDPAYVHITKHGQAAAEEARAKLASYGVFSVGRYGGWTYCSIEDNLVEVRELARKLLS